MIKIKYNCPESIEQMPKTACGFYCDACQKNIYDFRGKSEAEINAIKKAENVQCGVFDADMAREKSTTRIQTIFRLAFAAVFLFGFNATMLFGQTKVHYPDTVKTEVQISEKVIIKGTVYNHRKKPIEGKVSYYNDGRYFVVETDESGFYQIEVPRELTAVGKNFYLTFYADDMNTKYIDLSTGAATVFTIDVYLEKYRKRHRKHRLAGRF